MKMTEEVDKFVHDASDLVIWRSWDTGNLPDTKWDYERSTISGYEISGAGRLDLSGEVQVFMCTTGTKELLEKYDILPNVPHGHLVKISVLEALSKAGYGSIFQEVPVELKCRSGVLCTEFYLLRPLYIDVFYDISKSSVDLNKMLKKFYFWRRLVPLVKGTWREFFRETHSDHLVVSRKFSNIMKVFNVPNEAFTNADDYNPW